MELLELSERLELGGNMIRNLEEFPGLNCTINTTEQCNLRCRYCYEVSKRSRNIDFELCRKFIDMVTGSQEQFTPMMRKLASEGMIFDFIGGDSFMDPALLERIALYITYRLNAVRHPARNRWRMSVSTNGTLFKNLEVRRFCEKWRDLLSVGVSIDGCPEIHDRYRVFPNGEGSMDKIRQWLPWYRGVFPIQSRSTKSTCSKASIPYLYESLVYMHEELGFDWINQNFIMEDTGCTEEDYKLLDRQMEKCVRYVLDHRNEMYWGMIDRQYLQRRNPDDPIPDIGRCGSGCMPCLSLDGLIYPCFRWLPISQPDGADPKIAISGDVKTGEWFPGAMDLILEKSKRSECTRDPKCLRCEYEPCCPFCIGGCYAEFGDFIRTTHICEITKLQAKWTETYWREYESLENVG